jgi:hypothetical protein
MPFEHGKELVDVYNIVPHGVYQISDVCYGCKMTFGLMDGL